MLGSVLLFSLAGECPNLTSRSNVLVPSPIASTSYVIIIHCSLVIGPMYVVMEYMCHGDLLGFLRASRGHHGLYNISPGTRYQPPTLNLCSRDLLNVATKIANGMRYLSDRKVYTITF